MPEARETLHASSVSEKPCPNGQSVLPRNQSLTPRPTTLELRVQSERASYDKCMDQIKLQPVIIDCANGAKLRDIKKEACVRIFK